MSVRKQLTVAWQNRPGELANVCGVLAEVGVNIEALATAEAGEYGAIRVVVGAIGAGVFIRPGAVVAVVPGVRVVG